MGSASGSRDEVIACWGRVPGELSRWMRGALAALLVVLVGASVWLVVFDAPWELRVLAWFLIACVTLLPILVWSAQVAYPDLVPKLLQTSAWLIVTVYVAAAAAPTGVGWAWPVAIWPDLFARDTIVIDVVQDKHVEHHTHCGQYGGCHDEEHYWIRVDGHDWAVSQSTYQLLDLGELVELAFRPHTRLLQYVAYGPALSQTRGPDEVRLAVGLAPLEREVFEEQVLPIVKKRTGLDVSFVQLEADQLVDLLSDAAGSPFDLLVVDNNRVGALAAEEFVQDLTRNAQLIPTEVLPALDAVTRVDGKLMFFPFRPNVMVNFYDKTEFERLGTHPPRTWDEVTAVARTLREHGSGVALQGARGPASATQLVELIWQAGGDPLVLDDPGTVEAFTFLAELAPLLSDKTDTAQYDTVNRYFERRRVSLAPNWAFGVRDLVVDHQRDDIGVYAGWSGPAGSAHVLGGDVIGIPSLSDHRKPALEVAEQLMSKEIQSILARELFWPSMRTDAYDSVDPKLETYWDAINDAMATATARPTIPCWSHIESHLSSAWHDITEKGADVQATLDRVAPAVAHLAVSDLEACPEASGGSRSATTFSTLAQVHPWLTELAPHARLLRSLTTSLLTVGDPAPYEAGASVRLHDVELVEEAAALEAGDLSQAYRGRGPWWVMADIEVCAGKTQVRVSSNAVTVQTDVGGRTTGWPTLRLPAFPLRSLAPGTCARGWVGVPVPDPESPAIAEWSWADEWTPARWTLD